MGAYLDAPIKDKNPEPGQNEMAVWGACAMQGWRCSMEDAHLCKEVKIPNTNDKGMIFAVFDGHGGKEVAEYAKAHFIQVLIDLEEFKKHNFEKALIDAFMKLDENLKQEDFSTDTGSTSCVVFVTKNKIYCANAGDSRGILYSGGKVHELSHDHKPDNKEEQDRIEKANHMVEDQRVDGNLALSRAFGDYQYKDQRNKTPEQQAVTAFPEIICIPRSRADEYIMVACDGIWDCLSNEECCKLINEKTKELAPKDSNICPVVESILDQICAVNTEDGIGTDNMTAILIKLNNSNLH